MHVPTAEVFRTRSRPLEPIPTGQRPVLGRLAEIRAVLFDVYGTLFISGSGEVGTLRESACGGALSEALDAAGMRTLRPAGRAGVDCLFQVIERSHAASREAGVQYPEVDIVEVWREVLAELVRLGVLEDRAWERANLERLAAEYEARANPVWPMPGVEACLRSLSARRLLLGIVSNGQFYTRELFSGLLGHPAEFWGFDRELQYYSYQYGRAKPGPDLHQMAANALSGRGLDPSSVLYVGNDVLNDLCPAAGLGFRTALFAGDARSLRLRPNDPRTDGVAPDLVLTALAELSECILI